MAEYKLYVLGPTGMIARAVWLDCADDAEALAEAAARETGEARELWAGSRLLLAFEPARRAG